MKKPSKKGSCSAHTKYLALLVSLAFLHPHFKQLDDGFFHPLRCVGTWKELSDLIHGELQVPCFGFLLLHHNAEHGIIVQLALLGETLHPLGLGKRRGCLFAVDGLDKEPLFVGFEIGNLDRRGHTDFALIDHFLQFGLKLVQPNVTLNLRCTIGAVFSDQLP